MAHHNQTHRPIELDKLFSNAKLKFLATLAPEEKGHFTACASADQLLSDVRAAHHLRKTRRVQPMMNKIQSFTDYLTPYFKVIEIVCQSNPDWTCIAWGAFRLILQLATNFATFFDKLSKLIERLTANLPQYTEYYELLCSGHNNFSPRLLDSLVNFYVDMLDFFQAVAKIFSRPSGKLKRTPIVIADLMWRPFEVRFQEVLQRMEFHQVVLKDELNLASMKSLQSKLDAEMKRADHARLKEQRHAELSEDIKRTLSEDAQRTFRAAVVTWLAPPSFKDNFENAQDSREEGTAEWLFDDSKFKMWVSSHGTTASQNSSPSDYMLWVQGNPGWGKTVVAASTIEELRSRDASYGTKPIVCYYFFNQQDLEKASSARTAAYRAITAQIFHECHTMEAIHNIYALANNGSNSTASEHELRDLLNMTIPLLSDIYLVLDGLDELNDAEKFMADVRSFCNKSLAKVILFSRPHVAPLRDILLSRHTITMSRGIMNVDIRVFVRHEIAVLRDRNRFPQDTDLRLVEDEIVKRADGMFLWARLMICYLNSPALTKSQRMSTIFKTTPVGLQQMYDRILSQIRSMDDASQKLAITAFSWIAYAMKDLTAKECSDAVYCTTGPEDVSEKKDFIDKAVIVVCCGLIEKRQNDTLRFIHLTVKEHLLSSISRGQRPLILSSSEAHMEIATRCLSYLLFSLPAQPLSGCPSAPAYPVPLRHQYPLLPYSAKYWPKHILEGFMNLYDDNPCPERRERLTRLFNLIEKFLSHPINITAWIEAAFLFDGEESLLTVHSMLDVFRNYSNSCPDLNDFFSTVNTLALFANDLQQIRKHWKTVLRRSPHEIWGDVSSFTKSQFLAQSQGVAIETFAPTRDDHPAKRTDPIFCIGSESSDSMLIGKLTIYPSCTFNDLWKSKPPTYDKTWFLPFIDSVNLQEVCKEWFAQYEIHRIGGDSERLYTKYIPLSAEEVSLQMQFSFRLSVTRTWKLKFPMAISPDLSTIVVLRTIMTIDPSSQQQDKSNKVLTDVPEFSRYERLRHSWSKKSFAPSLPYSYRWVFSQDSSYAIFRDWNMEAYYGSLVVLRLIRSHSSIQSSIIKYRAIERESDLQLCAVHPVEPKFVMLDNDKIIFMNLETGEEYFQYPLTNSPITKLQFSNCGKYYVLDILGSSRPHIYPLPWSSSDEGPSESTSTSGIHITKKRKLEASSKGSFEVMVSDSNGLLRSVGSSSSAIDPHANMVLSISPEHSNYQGASQRIQLTRHEMRPENSSFCTLATIPQTADPRSTKATFALLDRHGRKQVRIVLTPEVQNTYESDTPTVSPYLPAVINRETATLIPYRVQDIMRIPAPPAQLVEIDVNLQPYSNIKLLLEAGSDSKEEFDRLPTLQL